MPAGQINNLLNIIAAMNAMSVGEAPFTTHKDIYSTIDVTNLSDAPWDNSNLNYQARRMQILHHGNLRTSLSGSATPSLSFTIYYPALTLMGYLTICHFRREIRTTTIGMKT